MELSTWTEEHYLPRFFTQMKLSFGGKRVRCETCRLNFASFRAVKELYRRRRTVVSATQQEPVTR